MMASSNIKLTPVRPELVEGLNRRAVALRQAQDERVNLK